MALLDVHLDQIEFCANSIAELPFQQPKIFTNALLRSHDITALIRDTESHERALFSLTPQSEYAASRDATNDPSRRSTIFNNASDGTDSAAFRAPRRNTAVAAVLGGDMAERIRKERAGHGSRRAKGDIDVELLLRGAEKLCGVYPMPGAVDRIAALRRRHTKVQESLQQYESLISEQVAQLDKMNRPSGSYIDDDEEEQDDNQAKDTFTEPAMSAEDLRREEESVRELERKKQTLEERVTGMEKDLGGLLR